MSSGAAGEKGSAVSDNVINITLGKEDQRAKEIMKQLEDEAQEEGGAGAGSDLLELMDSVS